MNVLSHKNHYFIKESRETPDWAFWQLLPEKENQWQLRKKYGEKCVKKVADRKYSLHTTVKQGGNRLLHWKVNRNYNTDFFFPGGYFWTQQTIQLTQG